MPSYMVCLFNSQSEDGRYLSRKRKISVPLYCALQKLMEWIYTQTKMSGQGSLEFALIMKKKERLTIIFLVLACTIVLMNDLGLVR